MNELKLSVVIPACNEEKNIGPTLQSLTSELRSAGIPHEVIVVNDHSNDGTPLVVDAAARENPAIRLVTRRPPRGFGRAIRAGLEQVEGDVVVIYMADLSDDPADVIAYYRKIEEGYDCVFGSRFMKGGRVEKYPWVKLIVNRIVNKTIQWLFWCPFNDLTNAFKAYRVEVIRSSGPFHASHFNITIEMSLAALIRRYSIAVIPISWRGRTWGHSRLKLREMGRKYLSVLLKALAERFLMADDLVADRLAYGCGRAQNASRLERRLDAVENRLAELEERSVVAAGPTRPLGEELARRAGLG